MKVAFYLALVILLTGIVGSVYAEPYGYSLCNQERITCIQVRPGDTWYNLWPNNQERDVVMCLNRMNIGLRPGMLIAVPDNLSSLDRMDISPFSYHTSTLVNLIVVDLEQLAWGAYDANGYLVNWGPASGGQKYCPDIHSACKTPVGLFSIYSKRGADCFSTQFPIGRGGAPMPYCMFFSGGYALHGSSFLSGSNASHGCVRLFTSDAKWLNQSFTNLETKVLVFHY